MNGPEHYRAAERFKAEAQAQLDEAIEEMEGEVPTPRAVEIQIYLAAAQVHATLALAAATAYPAAKDYYGDESNTTRDWASVVE